MFERKKVGPMFVTKKPVVGIFGFLCTGRMLAISIRNVDGIGFISKASRGKGDISLKMPL